MHFLFLSPIQGCIPTDERNLEKTGLSDFTRPFVGQSQEFGAPVLLLYESKSRTPVALIFFKYVGSSASGICPVLTQICPLGLASPISFFYILNVFLMSRWSAVSVLAVM